MFEILIEAKTLPEAYHKSLYALSKNHEITTVTDYNTHQKEASITFTIEKALTEPMISKVFIGDPYSLEQYRQEVLDGILDFEVQRGKWDYTYHQRMERQIPWIIDELKRNPDTRRAVIVIRTEDDWNSTSPACLQNIQYFIRGDNKLHCKVLFRSNDLVKATFMNAFALIMLQKRIAETVGAEVGSYTHRSNSMHAYKPDWDMLDSFVTRFERGDDLTYGYVGDWDEMMEEARPDIAKMVEEQKSKV